MHAQISTLNKSWLQTLAKEPLAVRNHQSFMLRCRAPAFDLQAGIRACVGVCVFPKAITN